MNNKTVKKFELDPKSIKVKELLNKDFLELEIKAISTANPNRNGSSFSKEALEKAIPTFYNKPILGSFSVSQDDFRAHEADLSYDEDYEQLYYDYTDESSEIPLGLIRGDDTIKIVHSKKDGLDWLVFTCAIWVKYNYKQVKKLLKSKEGHKKVSVEVEVLSSEFDDEGIERINEFVFDGVTILGDKYETGIADAEMTILDMVDNALFQKKQKCLAFAYNELDKQNVETPDKVMSQEKDSNIQFNNEENPNVNEERPQVAMDKEKVNQEEGGISAMQLTMQAKIELLRTALEKALCGDGEDCCCYVWVMDICEKYVFFEFNGEKFRCPYLITELGEEHEVMLDLSAQERVVPSWEVFSVEEEPEEDEENIETESCGDREEESCGEKAEEACGDKESEACGDAKFNHEEGEGHKCIECTIRELIIDEEEAIMGYSHAEKHFEEEYPLIAKIFHEIKEEEQVHIGELQQALQMVSDETQEHIEEGIEEAKEIVAEEIIEQQEESEEESEGGMEKIFEEEKIEEKPEDNKEEFADDDSDDDKDDDSDDDKDDVSDDDKDDDDSDDKEDDSDDKDDPEDDTDDKDDDEDDDDEDDEPKEEEPKEEFAEEIDLNDEPDHTDLGDKPMAEIVAEATASIDAAPVQTEAENLGDAATEADRVLEDATTEIIGEQPEMPEAAEPEAPAEDKVEQPDDEAKAFEASLNPELNALLEKYAELEAKFNELNDAKKNEEANRLAKFGAEFINADEVVDEESKKNFISQVEEKCKAFEFESEEDVTKFAKGLMAMYYYEHQAVKKNTKENDFSVNINKPAYNDGNASNNKLKDAINKLNYLNKEE